MRTATVAVLAFQAFVWLLILDFGMASSPASWVLAATQLPGVMLLTELGWCCGVGGGFVISDDVVNRWGGLTPAGAPVLAVANSLILLALALPIAAAIARTRHNARPAS